MHGWMQLLARVKIRRLIAACPVYRSKHAHLILLLIVGAIVKEMYDIAEICNMFKALPQHSK